MMKYDCSDEFDLEEIWRKLTEPAHKQNDVFTLEDLQNAVSELFFQHPLQ